MANTRKKKADSELTLFDRVNRSDLTDISAADRKAFRKMLDETPSFWQTHGDLANRFEELLYEKINFSFALSESIRRKLASIRDGLGFDTADEMEKLLIQQICINWFRSWYLEEIQNKKFLDSHTTEAGLYWLKQLEAAQRRFRRSIESLARVRRLLADASLKDEQARLTRTKASEISRRTIKVLATS